MLSFTRVRRWSLLVVIALLLAPTVSAVAGTESDTKAATSALIVLSNFEAKGDAGSLYIRMHPDAREIIPRSAVVGWYTSDFFPLAPQPISEIISVEFVDWAWPVTGKVYKNTAEITYVQPFGEEGNLDFVQDTARLVKSQGRWGWFFGRSSDFVDAQVTRFPADSDSGRSNSGNSTSATQSNQRTNTTSPRASSGCTLVELFPGYPGYRGVLTGMLVNWGGLGDWVCLETLEFMDSSFDKRKVDTANMTAAHQLGIAGKPEDWTWENWMQIEAARGLPTQCYSCVLFSTDVVPINTAVTPDLTDPRILLGFPGRTMSRKLVNADIRTLRFWQDDYYLRATAYFWGGLLNAPQLLHMFDELDIARTTAGPQPQLNLAYLDISFDQGGYTWVPDTASREDQVYIFGYAVFWFTNERRMIPDFGILLRERLMDLVEEWYRTGDPRPLREYVEFYWSN